MKIFALTLRSIAAILVVASTTVHAAVETVDGASPGLGTLWRWLFGY